MTKDTRSKNTYFGSRNDIGRYLKEYTGGLAGALGKINGDELQRAYDVLRNVHASGGRVFVGGNGGSAAISDHLCCDFTKGIKTDKTTAMNVHSLVGSWSLFTAIANDIGYEQSLALQLEFAGLNGNDILLLISSSGNSSNIIKACEFAQGRAGRVISMTGFDGGRLLKLSDIRLHIPINNYGVIEDCHQILMHVLAQFHFLSTND